MRRTWRAHWDTSKRRSLVSPYVARGCNSYHVELCPALVGRDLYDTARKGCDSRRMAFAEGGCPILTTNRVAYAIAAASWGGRDQDRAPRWALGASDFTRTTREEFERFVPHCDATHMEKRPAWSKILAVWIDQAHREVTTFCLFYGAEHEEERRGALNRLTQLDLEDPNLWSEPEIFALWEELHWDWWESIKNTLQQALRDMGSQNPTEAELRYHLLNGPNGKPRFEAPLSFQMDHPEGLFMSRIEPRKLWEARSTLASLARAARAKAPAPSPSGTRAGGTNSGGYPIGEA